MNITYAVHLSDLSLVAIIRRKNLPDEKSQGVHSPLIDDLLLTTLQYSIVSDTSPGRALDPRTECPTDLMSTCTESSTRRIVLHSKATHVAFVSSSTRRGGIFGNIQSWSIQAIRIFQISMMRLRRRGGFWNERMYLMSSFCWVALNLTPHLTIRSQSCRLSADAVHARQKRAIDSPSKRTVHRTSATRDLERTRRSEHNLSKSSQGNQRDETRHYESANTTSREHEFREEDANLIKKKGGRIKGPSGSPEPPPGSYKPNSWPDRGRHSGQLFIGHNNTITPDVGGQQNVPDKDFPREQLGPKQPLYDPHKDTIPGEGFGKDHEESASRAGFRKRPLLEDSSPHGRLNFVNMEGRQPEQNSSQDRSLLQQTFDNLNEKGTEHVERDRGTSAGGSPPRGDNAEPEMLLQPETRPISHDQLVIEVKGIYAGLVMVEAKCIDIDEKQTAAAQEKDLSKKVQLKNDQWQSLIALHKQVGAIYRQKLLFSSAKRVVN